MSKKYKKEVSYAFVHNTAKQIFYKSYKDAYDAYHNREGKSELGLIQNKKVIMILNTKIISVKWAIACASRVLHIFEKKYPDDLRPRQALEAAMRWLNSPTKTNRVAAVAAAAAAYAAADAAYAAGDAAYAAYAAGDAATYTARSAAGAAAEATYAAVNATAYAAAANRENWSKEIAWQRQCLQSIVDRSIATIYLLKMQQNPKTTLPRDLQKLVLGFI